MGILTEQQLENGYFHTIGGFPSAKIIHTVAEYDGSERCCIAPTQLGSFYPEREHKKILKEWIHFLQANPTAFTALHFNSHVPQALFNAACCQKNLVELRCKWGRYGDLTALNNLDHLQFLYLGSCPSVRDLSPIVESEHLVSLYLQNFKYIEDYSPLAKLQKLEQLVISGPILADTPLRDLDFLCDMPNLRAIWLPNVTIRKKYTDEEWAQLRERSSHIRGVYEKVWWR